ncbi:MAG TPA: hypothetical protein VGZ22_24370 [Isosphaeraceae bacterium]|nr:hypothetical protein [Isosphaeraceae bacterium]
MRMANRLALALGTVVLLSAPALAQQRGGFGRGMGGGLMLLGNKGVQQELKLDAAQTEKVNSYVQETRAKRQEQFQKLQDLSQDERRTKMQELAKAANEETQKALKDLLTPTQLTRFNQIDLQQRGVMGAVADPELRSKLKITEDQNKQIQTLTEAFSAAAQEIRQKNQGDFQEIMKQTAPLRKETTDKITALLTEDQTKLWKDMTGEPYEVKFEPRPAN